MLSGVGPFLPFTHDQRKRRELITINGLHFLIFCPVLHFQLFEGLFHCRKCDDVIETLSGGLCGLVLMNQGKQCSDNEAFCLSAPAMQAYQNQRGLPTCKVDHSCQDSHCLPLFINQFFPLILSIRAWSLIRSLMVLLF